MCFTDMASGASESSGGIGELREVSSATEYFLRRGAVGRFVGLSFVFFFYFCRDRSTRQMDSRSWIRGMVVRVDNAKNERKSHEEPELGAAPALCCVPCAMC